MCALSIQNSHAKFNAFKITIFKLSALSLALLHANHSYAEDVQQLNSIELHATSDDASSEKTQAYITTNSSSASKLNLKIQETPQTVNVVTRQQIEDFNLSSSRDVLKNTPGVTVNNVETERAVYMARGFEISNILNDGIGSPASSYNYNNTNPDTFIYDRIEVIKGADALINTYGDPGATINQIRKRPTPEFQANLGISYGSWNTQRYEADVSGPVTQYGRVRARVMGYEQTGDSYLDRYALEKNGMAAILDADITDKTLVTVGYSIEKNKPNANNWGALPLLGSDSKQLDYDRDFNPNPDWTHWDYQTQNAFIELKQQLSANWNVQLSYNYSESDHQSRLMYYYGNPNPDGSGVNLTAWGGKEDSKRHIFDAQMKGTFDLLNKTHELVFGYNYVQTQQNDHESTGTIHDPAVVDSNTTDWASWTPQNVTWSGFSDASDYQQKTHSLYAASRLHLSDDLKLILGAHYVQAQSHGISYGSGVNYDEHKFSPYAGITYNFSPEYTGYMSYSSIFRPQIGVDKNNHALKPIDGKSYEIGLKSSWLNEKLTGNLAIFKTQQSNYPLRKADGNPLDRKVETSDLSAQGIEVGVAGQFTEHLNVSVGYAQFSMKDDINGGDARTYNPNQTFNLLTTYTLPQFPQLKLGASVQWQDDISLFEVSTQATIRQEAYALLNLMMSYQSNPKLSFQFNANNITNEKYLFSFPDAQAFYGPPSQYTASMKYKF